MLSIARQQRRRKRVKTKNGTSREIACDVLVDPHGNELPGQEFDEVGRCINEDEVLSRAANSGQLPAANQNDSSPSYAAPPQQYGQPSYYSQPSYGAPSPQNSTPQSWGNVQYQPYSPRPQYYSPSLQYGAQYQHSWGVPPQPQFQQPWGYGASPSQGGFSGPSVGFPGQYPHMW